MTRDGILPSMSDGSQTRVEGQTPNQQIATVFQAASAGGTFQKVVDTTKDVKYMQRQEFSDARDKRSRTSDRFRHLFSHSREVILDRVTTARDRVHKGILKYLQAIERSQQQGSQGPSRVVAQPARGRSGSQTGRGGGQGGGQKVAQVEGVNA
ncbi:hypothetical protein HAX54_005360 [Datura stramonium]|uniref:Uncharacterized protein n=1 Tax=Datura stramonium TaxID=4076 RepID=A0ABS8T8K3_DATST|nr:hypothetical protein [Datura stramonium]